MTNPPPWAGNCPLRLGMRRRRGPCHRTPRRETRSCRSLKRRWYAKRAACLAGFVEGIVRSQNNGLPVPGAFLQILGTGFATFADQTGHYHLAFDPNLVDQCRSQVVRVTAPGYRARTLILAAGSWSENTIQMAMRR